VKTREEEWPDDLGPTAKAKVIELRALDQKLEAKKSKKSEGEELFASQCLAYKLPAFCREYPFGEQVTNQATGKKRKWRIDFVFTLNRKPLPSGYQPPPYRLGVEIEGIVMRRVNGQWQMGGAHASIQGFKEDCIKYATAEMLGIHLVRFEQSQVASRFAIQMVIRILARNGWKPQS